MKHNGCKKKASKFLMALSEAGDFGHKSVPLLEAPAGSASTPPKQRDLINLDPLILET